MTTTKPMDDGRCGAQVWREFGDEPELCGLPALTRSTWRDSRGELHRTLGCGRHQSPRHPECRARILRVERLGPGLVGKLARVVALPWMVGLSMGLRACGGWLDNDRVA